MNINTAYRLVKKMQKQNPDLKLTVSSNSLAATDVEMVYAITYKQKKKIIKNLGISLFEFRPFPGDAPQFLGRYNDLSKKASLHKRPRIGLHAKSIVIDSEIAIIGSHNLDPRSANINTEVAFIIRDPEIARRVEQNILVDTEPQNSWVIAKRQKVPFISYFSNFIGSISSIIPFLDVWPFRYTSSYQLKDGMEPLAHDHPDFNKHYIDVGQFPGVDVSAKSIQTRLIKAFGGFTAPLM